MNLLPSVSPVRTRPQSPRPANHLRLVGNEPTRRDRRKSWRKLTFGINCISEALDVLESDPERHDLECLLPKLQELAERFAAQQA